MSENDKDLICTPNIMDNQYDQVPKSGPVYQKRLEDISHQIEQAFDFHQPLKEQITWFIQHGDFDMVKDYPEIQSFLATHEGQDFIKKFTILNNKQNIICTRQTSLPKSASVLKKTALYLLSALALQGAVSCNNCSKNQKEAKKLIEKRYIGTYSESLEQIKIAEDNDMGKEKTLYKNAFLHFDDAMSEINRLKLFSDENINFHRFLPLMIKESRLDAKAISRNGAVGYFQLKDIAITEVNDFLKEHKMSTSYSPKRNPAHNIMYGIIYFLNTAKQLQKDYPNIQDLDDFVYASYNAGITRMVKLIAASDADSREDLVHYIVHNKMGLSRNPTEIDGPYGPKMRNFFHDKDYSKDNTVIFSKNNTVLTRSKAQEFIRYVETINSIAQSIDKERSNLDVYKTVSLTPGSSCFSTIKNMKKDNTIKIRDGMNICDFCTDLALDNNLNPDNILPGSTLVITKDMMEKFGYLDINTHEYEVVPYNRENAHFLEKIVKAKIQEKTFNRHIIQKVKQLNSLEDQGDKEFYLLNSLIAFNEQHRKGWTTITSKDVWIPTDPKYYSEYFKESEKEAKDIEKNTIIDIRNNYTNPALELPGQQFVYEGNFNKNELSAIEKTFIGVVGRKQSPKKEKLTCPKYIILHSTAANVADVPGVKAHFFVSKKGTIYKITDKKGNFRQLNHAGYGTSGSGAIWSEDKYITYKSLGIEVEALGGEKWNNHQYTAVKKLVSYLGGKYKIKKKDVLAHSQVAASTFGRGRKQDPYYINRTALGLPNNYMEIDKDVANGKSPNMYQFVKKLKDIGLTDNEIKNYLSGIDAGITIANNAKVKKMNTGRDAWTSSSDILKRF